MDRSVTIQKLIEGLAETSVAERMKIRAQIVAFGKAAVPHLVAIVQKEGQASYRAVDLLADLAPEAALPVLIEAARSSHLRLAQASIEALGKMGDVQAVPVLVEQLKHSSSLIQMSAVQALELLGAHHAFEALIQLLQTTSSASIRYTIIESLGKLRDERAVPVIMMFQYDPDHHVRSRVARALEAFGFHS